MKNKSIRFFDEELGNLRGVYLDGQAWVYASEVCKILELGNVSQAVSRLDDDEKRLKNNNPPQIYNNDTSEKRATTRNYLLVNEPGIYRLIFTSRTPKARKFQRWVSHVVLPQLRREALWQEIRDEGKEIRRNLTDTIKLFCDYLKETNQLDRPEGAWYIIFTKLLNKKVGVDGARDKLSYLQLLRIQDCEDALVDVIVQGIAQNKTHHEIWLDCQNKLNVK